MDIHSDIKKLCTVLGTLRQVNPEWLVKLDQVIKDLDQWYVSGPHVYLVAMHIKYTLGTLYNAIISQEWDQIPQTITDLQVDVLKVKLYTPGGSDRSQNLSR